MERLNIAMIMDGNRRWATAKGFPAVKGHEVGAKTLERVLKWCKDRDIYSLTVYTFSTENFNRSESELDAIFGLFRRYYSDFKQRILEKNEGLRICFLGDLTLFPKDIQDICSELEESTKNESKYLLQFCFGYGGRQELVHAATRIAEKIENGVLTSKEITAKVFEQELYSSIEPDIVIRTGGAYRQSNFLPWQTTYSEWFYIDTFWPDVSTEILDRIVEDFKKRERRFGY